jgi:CubicO group peptidase (beta-lactamase class C family)
MEQRHRAFHERVALETVVLLLVASSARAGEPDGSLAGFDAYAEAALADWRTPGMAIAIVKDDKVVLARGYGIRRVGQHDPVDERTLFPIASVTKVFTATCLAQLVEQGRLTWSDPVVKHLPEFELGDPYLTRDVRIADLVAHRTGLETADLLAYRGDYDRAEILRRLRFLRPVAPFRSRYGYHNLMVVTAGEALERVTGESWQEAIRTRLLAPLGMTSTLSGPRELEGLDNVSTPHVVSEGRLIADPLWGREAGEEGFRRLHDAVAPAGAIQSNAVDMARFLRFHLNEGVGGGHRLLRAQTIREMEAPHSVVPIAAPPEPNFAYPRIFFGCGLGWWLRDYRGRKVVYHGGSSGAVAALMPEEKLGIVVLANRGCGLVYMVMHDTFDRMLGIPRTWSNRDWLVDAEEKPREEAEAKNARLEAARARDTRPSLPLRAYAGAYECDLYGKLDVREEGGSLRLQFGPNMGATLRHWEHDSFRGELNFPPSEEWFVRFQLSEGRVDRLEIERVSWHEPMPAFRRVRRMGDYASRRVSARPDTSWPRGSPRGLGSRCTR